MTQIISRFEEISSRYDAAFVDLWGCLHNGLRALPDAVAAMQGYRARGGKVVLVTNSPRPWDSVAEQIKGFGIPKDAWDAIATSGDSARAAMYLGAVGEKVWFMGESPRDDDFFKPLKIIDNPAAIEKVALEDAQGIVCCGPFDPLADPADLRPQLLLARERGLKLLCANPDIVVDRGDVREWCAGAVAQIYSDMGGESLYFGKPHAPIYDLAKRRLAALTEVPPDDAIICIGDGLITDIKGGIQENLDTLFITGGLAAAETQTTDQPDPGALRSYLEMEMASPTFSIGFLR